MRNRLYQLLHDRSLPEGVRMFAWVRAIRWIGWGLGESLLPVFILMFSKTFAEMGLFSATVDIASLLSLPLIGTWADRLPAKRLVAWSLLIYPLVGLSYFLAGAVGLAIFVVLARVVNGFAWELENIGIATYYRRSTPSQKMAFAFGYLDTWSHVAWIGASLVGIVLILFLPIHYLLLGIAPFALIAYLLLRKVPEDKVTATVSKPPSFWTSYGQTLVEWRTWNTRLWLLSLLIIFGSLINALMYFFVPIDAYLAGANLPMIILITILGALPALFGSKLGRLTDPRDKNWMISLGLGATAVVSTGLALFPQYGFKLLAVILMGIILELFYVAESSLITTLGPAETYGRRGGAFESINVLGDMVAPIIIGVALDMMGFANLSYVIAFLAVILTVVYWFMKEESPQIRRLS